MTEYKCGSAKSCKYGDMCKPNFNIGACSHYKAEEPQTNEKWLHSLNAEQLAEFISKIDMPFMDKAPFPCGDLIECSKNCGLYSRCVKDDFPTNKEVWVEWLKQPHTQRSDKNAE